MERSLLSPSSLTNKKPPTTQGVGSVFFVRAAPSVFTRGGLGPETLRPCRPSAAAPGGSGSGSKALPGLGATLSLSPSRPRR